MNTLEHLGDLAHGPEFDESCFKVLRDIALIYWCAFSELRAVKCQVYLYIEINLHIQIDKNHFISGVKTFPVLRECVICLSYGSTVVKRTGICHTYE